MRERLHEGLMKAVKSGYGIMKANQDVTSLSAYERAIEPSLLGVKLEERLALGQALREEHQTWQQEHKGELYPYTGLVEYLDPRPGGS